jgi:hypothetical protein
MTGVTRGAWAAGQVPGRSRAAVGGNRPPPGLAARLEGSPGRDDLRRATVSITKHSWSLPAGARLRENSYALCRQLMHEWRLAAVARTCLRRLWPQDGLMTSFEDRWRLLLLTSVPQSKVALTERTWHVVRLTRVVPARLVMCPLMAAFDQVRLPPPESMVDAGHRISIHWCTAKLQASHYVGE